LRSQAEIPASLSASEETSSENGSLRIAVN